MLLHTPPKRNRAGSELTTVAGSLKKSEQITMSYPPINALFSALSPGIDAGEESPARERYYSTVNPDNINEIKLN